MPPLLGLAPGGVYRSQPVARLLVSSYLAISPLPRTSRGGMFLWHYPWGCPHWALPSTLLYGVRTFLT